MKNKYIYIGIALLVIVIAYLVYSNKQKAQQIAATNTNNSNGLTDANSQNTAATPFTEVPGNLSNIGITGPVMLVQQPQGLGPQVESVNYTSPVLTS